MPGSETGLENWDLALSTITLQLNHSLAVSAGHKPYELRFNGRSYFASSTWVTLRATGGQRLQLEGENGEQTSSGVYGEGICEAITQGRGFVGSAVVGSIS